MSSTAHTLAGQPIISSAEPQPTCGWSMDMDRLLLGAGGTIAGGHIHTQKQNASNSYILCERRYDARMAYWMMTTTSTEAIVQR